MTIDQIISTFNACLWLLFIAAIVWQYRKQKAMKVYDLMIIETQANMLALQRGIDNRHVLLYLCYDQPIDRQKWEEHTAEITANQLVYDLSIKALRKQLTKL